METVAASDYHEFSRLFHPAVSPDSDRVAFLKRTPDGDREYETTVHVASVGGDEARRFTVAEGEDSEPTWSPSGDRLAFVSTRGADDDRPQLWVLPTEGGEAEQVTDVVGGVSNVAWGPEGERIAFVQSVRPEERDQGLDLEHDGGSSNERSEFDGEYEREDPDPRVIDRHVYRANEAYSDGAWSHVYVLDLAAGEIERVTEGVADCLGPSWGAEDLYYPVRRGVDADDRLAWDVEAWNPESDDVGDGEVVTTVEEWGPVLAVDGSRESGDRIAYTTRPAYDPTLAQIEVDVFHRGSDQTERLTANLDRTLELWNDAHAPEWSPSGDHLYVCTPNEGSYVLRRIDADTGDVDVVLGGDRHVHGFSVAESTVGVVQSEWDHPGEVVAATPAGGEENRLTRANRDYLDDRAVGQPEEFWFDSPGGEVQGWVLTPPDFDPEKEYPLAVEIHGGPHRMWSTTGSLWHEFQTLAARGYVVFWCNPRGSSGYGQAWLRAIERDWGDVTLEDVLAGARAVADRDYVDADNAFVTGGSFGGFMTAWTVGHTDFFAGAVAQRGVYDLTGFYGSTDVYQLVEGDFRAEPWDEPEFLWEQSPVAHAENVDTPTLVLHSEHDYRTPANTAELFYRALRKHGVESRFVRYPREGHELSRSGEPGHVVDRIERIARWFDGYSDHHDAPRALDRERGSGLSDDGA